MESSVLYYLTPLLVRYEALLLTHTSLDPFIFAKAICYFIHGLDDELVDMMNEDLISYSNRIDTGFKFQPVKKYIRFDKSANTKYQISNTREGESRSRVLPLPLQYNKVRDIAQGAFASVSLASINGEEYAIKTQHAKQTSVIYPELHVLSTFSHNNIIHMYDFRFLPETNLVMISLEPGKSLSSILYPEDDEFVEYSKWERAYIFCDSESPVQKTQRRKWMKEICDGVAYLHSVGVIHRDIKPGNVIIVNNVAKIADFGSCYLNCLSYNDYGPKSKAVYTIGYTPPEIDWLPSSIEDGGIANNYSFTADTWAVGVTLVEIETGCRMAIPLMLNAPKPKYGGYPNDLLETIPEKNEQFLKQLAWCTMKVVGIPPIIYNPPYKEEITNDYPLKCIKDLNLRETLLSMLDYKPKYRVMLDEVNF